MDNAMEATVNNVTSTLVKTLTALSSCGEEKRLRQVGPPVKGCFPPVPTSGVRDGAQAPVGRFYFPQTAADAFHRPGWPRSRHGDHTFLLPHIISPVSRDCKPFQERFWG